MLYVGKILTLAREFTNNINYGVDSSNVPTSGVSQDLALTFLNDAQDHLQSRIIQLSPQMFVDEVTISLSSATEGYSITTTRLFANSKVISVEYSYNGDTKCYEPLPVKTFKERDTRESNFANFYIREDNTIYVNPILNPASSGTLRVMVYRELDDLDIRRGTISGTPSGTSIVLSSPTSAEEAAIAEAEYLCVSNKFGDVLLYGGKISSYNAGTDTITLAANVSTYLVSGYTLANLASCYITFGKWSTTHSKLPDICERYLRVAAQKRFLVKDASVQMLEEDKELMAMEADIMATYSQPTEDINSIPIVDKAFFY